MESLAVAGQHLLSKVSEFSGLSPTELMFLYDTHTSENGIFTQMEYGLPSQAEYKEKKQSQETYEAFCQETIQRSKEMEAKIDSDPYLKASKEQKKKNLNLLCQRWIKTYHDFCKDFCKEKVILEDSLPQKNEE